MSVAEYATSQKARRVMPRRKVSDDEIKRAAVSGLTSAQASKLFGVTSATLNYRAARLGVGFRTIERHVWSEADDGVVRAVAVGRMSLKLACRGLRVGSASFKARAKILGMTVHKPRCGTLVEGAPIFHELFEPCLSVGDRDMLLEKLREVHGEPRSEIYPGSDGPVRRFKPETAW